MHIPTIQEEHQTVRQEYGDAAAEEWRKGLLAKGKALMAIAARWDRWESQLPNGEHPADTLRNSDPACFPRFFDRQAQLLESNKQPVEVNHVQAPAVKNGKLVTFDFPIFNFYISYTLFLCGRL